MSFLLYGCNGYTGALIAEESKRRGLRPVLAARNRDKVVQLAQKLDLPYEVFDLSDSAAMDQVLQKVPLVLHCAGPFSRTARPMIEGCLRNGVHYLDVTGEIEVFEMAASYDEKAQQAGVMIMPGVGFDVVPTDCLALHLKSRLPSATHLRLAVYGVGGGVSHGTATTILENVGKGGWIRRDGKMTKVPEAWKSRRIDFGDGPRMAISAPWGDVSTAFYTTGIGNIEVYMALPRAVRRFVWWSRYFGWLFSSSLVQNFAKKRIKAGPAGPSEEEREQGRSMAWGEVEDDQGQRATSRIEAPEGYKCTVLTALQVVAKVSEGNAPKGFQTPAKAYGADLIMEIENVVRKDID